MLGADMMTRFRRKVAAQGKGEAVGKKISGDADGFEVFNNYGGVIAVN